MWSFAGMSNVLDDDKQQQVLALGRLGWTLRRIAAGDGRPSRDGQRLPARRRASRCAAADGRRRRSQPKPAISGGGVHRLRAAKPAISRARCPPTRPADAGSRAECERLRAVSRADREALGRGRNAMAIWQDLVDDHGFTARYASVRRFVVKLRGDDAAEARVVITTAPGEEGQVDYGEGPMVRDPRRASTAARGSSS